MSVAGYFIELKNTRILVNEPLSRYTTYRIGGPADCLLLVDSQADLVESIRICRRHNLRFRVLGGGSNILVNDRGFRGVVIRDRSPRYTIADTVIECESGVLLRNLAFETVHRGLAGIEFGCCIYGTLGGAVYGNAGAYGISIGDVVIGGRVLLPDGRIHTVARDFFKFEYRSSSLKTSGAVLLAVTLQLRSADPLDLIYRVKNDMDRRLERHPLKEGSAGSYFKNLPPLKPGEHRVPAGKILDELGVKGMRRGNAAVYEKHANFIVNPGHATAAEVRGLAEQLKKLAKEKKNIELEEEVIYIPERS